MKTWPGMSVGFLMVMGLAVPMGAQSTGCGQVLATDARAVSADLSAISAQAKAQGFPAAVEKFAADLEVIVPTLDRPSQAAVEKLVTDLEQAVSASSPGGTTISAGERLILTNDLVAVASSTGLTQAQFATITADLTAVLGTLEGISTAQLQADLQILVADAQACRVR